MKRLVISLFTCLFAALPLTATAQSMHTLQTLADATPNSEVYAGKVMWIARHWTEYGVASYMSAVRLNNIWGVSAAHVFDSSTVTPPDKFIVGTGSNWMTDPGETREIVEWITYPGWTGTFNGQAVDLAVFRWEEPLEGEDLEIGALSLGELFEYVGYGRPATPGTGNLPLDGKRRVFDVKAHEWGSQAAGISTDYAKSPFFSPGSPNYLVNGGIGTGGGSGSPGFNQDGKLVGVLVAQSSSPSYGFSYGLRLDLYADWIAEKTYVAPDEPNLPVVPVRLCRDRRYLGTLSSEVARQHYVRSCRKQLLTSLSAAFAD